MDKTYLSECDAVLAAAGSRDSGLTADEAAARLREKGPNELDKGKKTTVIERFLHELADPMTLILIAAAVISGITSAYAHESFADVIIILAVVIINAVLGVLQESKAEKAIEALQQIAAATSKVVRGGVQKTIPSAELVPGDVIVLEAGDSVPADARLIECASLKAEEAALTGESVPVSKDTAALTLRGEEKDVPLGDRKNMVYLGSNIVYGRGRAVVTGTGMDTEMGKIAGALTAAADEETPLQKRLNQLSRVLSVLVLVLCAVIFAVDVLRTGSAMTGERLLDTFMVAVSLAVAAIPEGLAAVVTIVLSIGVTKMAKRNAVIRRLTAVETLGCTQVICSDKTGTLTQNKMTVVEHAGSDPVRLALAMALASDAKCGEDGQAVGEPTECALVNDAMAMQLTETVAQYVRIGEAPFDSVRKMMTTVCRGPGGHRIQFTKGAPDVVLSRCTMIWENGTARPMTDADRAAIAGENKSMADRALRVLCAAQREWTAEPETYEPDALEQQLCYLGLCGMIDPIRPEVKPAIAQCRAAGIRPVMITGDHIDTASAIARELGILGEGQQAVAGAALDAMSDTELADAVEGYSVYARVQPEHKVRIVNAWRAKGCVTAMTGDGVNDAPSIKSADIGVGMGITGTDVTKNVADMVLADDNFATIVSAVAEGRRIYDNIRKAIQFLLSSNLAEVLSIFFATMAGFTVLKPVHLLWINLITDCFPALALGMEDGEPDIMNRPPRRASDGIFAGGLGLDAALQGIAIAALTVVSYVIGHRMESGVWALVTSPDGMTMAFLTLSLVEICHSFNMRARRQSIFRLPHANKWLWGSALVSVLCTVAVVYVPFLANAFGFESISAAEFGVAVLLALVIIPIIELTKWIQRKIERKRS